MRGVIRAVLLGALPVGLAAQAPPRAAFLSSWAPTTRSAGLSGAGGALLGFAGSVFLNPAGLAPIRTMSLEAAGLHRGDGTTYGMGALATGLGRVTLGGGYQYLKVPPGGDHRREYTVSGSGAYRLIGPLVIGATARYLEIRPDRTAGTLRSNALETDAGVAVALLDIASFSFHIEDLSHSTVSGPAIDAPASYHLGFSMNLLDVFSNGRFLAVVETIWTDGAPRRTLVGTEVGFAFGGLGLVGRVGTGGQRGGANLSETNLGGSVLLGRARLDYAYQPRSLLGRRMHSVGLRWTP